MKKRKIIQHVTLLVLAIVITAIQELTDIDILSALVSVAIIIVVSGIALKALALILTLYNSQRSYSNLVESQKIIKHYQNQRYKTYFKLEGEELKKEIQEYDSKISEFTTVAEDSIAFLLEPKYKKYITKKQFAYVIEMADAANREASRG